jgi:dTDP-4-dehydrorhamnose reductase
MRVMVTGANGMLGIDLCEILAAAGHDPIRTDTVAKEHTPARDWTLLDITDTGAVMDAVTGFKPDSVIHVAAYTDVDGCERNPGLAFRVNVLGTWNMAAACAERDIPLFYVSTDFVFDGRKTTPYTEMDATNPLNHYGASKLAGERHVRELCRKHFICRTAWLFGIHGKSFPATMLNLAKTRTELPVVSDQVGCPTHTVDLAKTIASLLGSPLYGTYHITNTGSCSWFDLARKTLQLAGVTSMAVKAIPASEYPSPTTRPAYSVLRHQSLEIQGRDLLPPWEEALAEFIRLRQAAHPL